MNQLKHVSIIMDGNGRWAHARGLRRVRGHMEGARTTLEIIRYASQVRLNTLSLFAFSKENWQRPWSEVNALMRLFTKVLSDHVRTFDDLDIRLTVIGDRRGLSKSLIEKIYEIERETSKNAGLNLVIALNYSGQYDVCQAVERMAKEERALLNIEPRRLESFLLTASMPNPDLVIRTGGESRLSNFYLWQCAYAEIHFEEKLWPDFHSADLAKHIEKFVNTERRFGKTSAQVTYI